jgi:hypothetical protein
VGEEREKCGTSRRMGSSIGEEIFVSGNDLESVREFNKYLGRILDMEDDNSKAVQRNLTKAKQQWGWLKRVLASKKGRPKMMAKFYMAIVSSVLLFGAET